MNNAGLLRPERGDARKECHGWFDIVAAGERARSPTKFQFQETVICPLFTSESLGAHIDIYEGLHRRFLLKGGWGILFTGSPTSHFLPDSTL
jgi:hypothetical protein